MSCLVHRRRARLEYAHRRRGHIYICTHADETGGRAGRASGAKRDETARETFAIRGRSTSRSRLARSARIIRIPSESRGRAATRSSRRFPAIVLARRASRRALVDSAIGIRRWVYRRVVRIFHGGAHGAGCLAPFVSSPIIEARSGALASDPRGRTSDGVQDAPP